MTGTRIMAISAVWPWPLRYDLGQWSWHILESWTTMVIQIKLGNKKFLSGQGFKLLWLYFHGYPFSWTEQKWYIWFVGFKIRGHCIFLHNSHRKLPFRGYWTSRKIGTHEIIAIPSMCELSPWPFRYYLGSRSWHTWVEVNNRGKNRCLWNTNAPFPNIPRIGLIFDLDLSPTNLNFDRGHLLVKDYLPTKFETSGAKHSWVTSYTRCRRTTWPLTTDLNINRDHLLIMDYLPTKVEAYGAKRSWVTSCTRCGIPTWPLTYWPGYQ